MKKIKQKKYISPVIRKVKKLRFPVKKIEQTTGAVCLQCSSCHGCR